MSLEIVETEYFLGDVKFYIKKRKYTKIVADIKTVTDELKKGNLIGNKLDNLGLQDGDVYKVSIANTSANEGKSNGFRLLYYAVVNDKAYLLTIYSKKDDSRIPNDSQIANIVRNVMSST